ncbi:MAG: hypothetical protein PHH73_00015 [Candidatus Rickettsiella isopodorum]|nr:hypothetical protein [Candidatus Rickettsiella isopodorum]
MEQGYIKLYRSITEKSWWLKQRFTWGQAWIDMLLMAKHKNMILTVNYKPYDVPLGSFVTSQRKLAERWRWSISTVNSFLNYLQKAECQIEHKTEHSFTHIYILNWKKHQGKSEHLTEHETETFPNSSRTVAEYSPKQIKNDNNDKNVNNKDIYLDFVFLTKEEHTKLITLFGESGTTYRIKNMNDYAHQIGEAKFKAKYKSHYHTILNWERRSIKSDNQPNPSGLSIAEQRKIKELQDDIKKCPICKGDETIRTETGIDVCNCRKRLDDYVRKIHGKDM